MLRFIYLIKGILEFVKIYFNNYLSILGQKFYNGILHIWRETGKRSKSKRSVKI